MLKRISGRVLQNKSSVELQEIVQGAKLCVKDLYVKGTEKSLIMSVTTEQVHWIRFQCVWYLGVQIGNVSPLLKHVVEHVISK